MVEESELTILLLSLKLEVTMKYAKIHAIKEAFDQDGYVLLPGFLSQEEMEVLNKKLESFIREKVPSLPAEHAFYEKKDDASTLKQLFELHTYDPYFKKLLTERTFRKLAELVLQEKVIAQNVEYFNKPPRIGQPTPPHQDNYYFMLNPPAAVTMWLALEVVDQENGCVRYVKGSHLQGMRPHGKSGIFGFSQGIVNYGSVEDRKHEVAIPAQPGDLLIHHSMTIHRADANTSATRSRRALGLLYWGESAQEATETKEAYKKAMAEEIRNNAIE